MRPLVEKDIVAAYERFARIAVDIINQGDEALPQLFFVQMDENEPGEIAGFAPLDPGMVNDFQRTDLTKRMFGTVIKQTLEGQGVFYTVMKEGGITPQLAVHVTEIWKVNDLPKGDPLRDLKPSQRLDRRDALAVFVHVKEHSYGQFMDIHTKAKKRSVVFKQIEPHDPSYGIAGGTLSMHQTDAVKNR